MADPHLGTGRPGPAYPDKWPTHTRKPDHGRSPGGVSDLTDHPS
jgi:hypothetical protein